MFRSVPALLCAIVCAASLAAAQSASSAGASSRPAPDRLKVGIAHFEKAFYDLTPHKRDAEAAAEFRLAVAAFEGVLAETPGSVQAHTYLARIHAAGKNFRKAASHYDEVAALEPLNVDACILAALAYLDANDAPEARLRVLEARRRTTDPGVLATLEEYLKKIDALKR